MKKKLKHNKDEFYEINNDDGSVLDLINFILRMLELLFHYAEALHWTGVKCNFSFLFNGVIDKEFVDRISHPGVSTSLVFFV